MPIGRSAPASAKCCLAVRLLEKQLNSTNLNRRSTSTTTATSR
jgi:hypothetical protein